MQKELFELYEGWRERIQFESEEFEDLGPPHLINPPESYQQSERRVLVYGQETRGWAWTHDTVKQYPAYEQPWKFDDVASLGDFKQRENSVRALMHGYRMFDFARPQPGSFNASFFRGFREISADIRSEPVWANVVKVDYQKPDAKNMSIWSAPEPMRQKVLEQQADIIRKEVSILQPNCCVFFSGPDYDEFIAASFEGCLFETVDGFSIRHIAKIRHDLLPEDTYRTYHPNYLRRSHQWHLIKTTADCISNE